MVPYATAKSTIFSKGENVPSGSFSRSNVINFPSILFHPVMIRSRSPSESRSTKWLAPAFNPLIAEAVVTSVNLPIGSFWYSLDTDELGSAVWPKIIKSGSPSLS